MGSDDLLWYSYIAGIVLGYLLGTDHSGYPLLLLGSGFISSLSVILNPSGIDGCVNWNHIGGCDNLSLPREVDCSCNIVSPHNFLSPCDILGRNNYSGVLSTVLSPGYSLSSTWELLSSGDSICLIDGAHNLLWYNLCGHNLPGDGSWYLLDAS